MEEGNFASPLYADIEQIFFSEVNFKGILGQGRWSNVLEVRILGSKDEDGQRSSRTQKTYALKYIDPDRIEKYVESKDTAPMPPSTAFAAAAEELYREASLLANCRHRNIISLRGSAVEGLVGSFSVRSQVAGSFREKLGYFTTFDVIQETLAQRIAIWRNLKTQQSGPFSLIGRRRLSKSKNSYSASSMPLSESPNSQGSSTRATSPSEHSESRGGGDLAERIEIARGIASAIAYLHTDHDIVIFDLCPESIGFDAQTGEVKLFNLGQARSQAQSILNMQLDRGNARYKAPEIMICQNSGFPGDIYSFGVLFWELVTLQQPYEDFFTTQGSGKSRKEIFEQSKFTKQVILNKQWRPNCTSIVDPETRRLIQECWCADPEARPNAEQVRWRLEQTISQPRRASFSLRRSSFQSQSASASSSPSDNRVRRSVMRGFRGSFRRSNTSNLTGTSEMEAAAAAVAADPFLYEDFEEPAYLTQRSSSSPSMNRSQSTNTSGSQPTATGASTEGSIASRSLSLQDMRSRLNLSIAATPAPVVVQPAAPEITARDLPRRRQRMKAKNLLPDSNVPGLVLPGAYRSTGQISVPLSTDSTSSKDEKTLSMMSHTEKATGLSFPWLRPKDDDRHKNNNNNPANNMSSPASPTTRSNPPLEDGPRIDAKGRVVLP